MCELPKSIIIESKLEETVIPNGTGVIENVTPDQTVPNTNNSATTTITATLESVPLV